MLFHHLYVSSFPLHYAHHILPLSTNPPVQVKTHAQMIMRRVDAGEDVFADLRAYENATMIRPPYPPLSKETIKMYQKLTSVDQGAVQILLMLHKNKFS